MRYKAWLVAHDFIRRPRIDFKETYSLVMDIITFCFLISLVIKEELAVYFIDVTKTYLYGSLDNVTTFN